MSRFKALIAAFILLASLSVAIFVIYQAATGHISMRTIRYTLGVLLIIIGLSFTALYYIVGPSPGSPNEKLWRGGWIGALVGVATIIAEYFLGTGR
jgi:hypothetical protein